MSARNRILVVEDDASILDLICMNLEAAGYETIAVGDGLEAERLLRENGPDTADGALVDIMLPGKDGFELMEDFKKQGIPVLYLTAKGDVASKVKGCAWARRTTWSSPSTCWSCLSAWKKCWSAPGK